MKHISIKAILKPYRTGEITIVPVTKADEALLKVFTDTNKENYLTVELKNTKATKTYSQLKTVWALMSIMFESLNYRKPTKNELDEFHTELLNEYSDRKPSLLHEDKTVPVTLREMTSQQLSSFIQTLIRILAEDCELNYAEQMSVRELFCEWENYLSSLEQDFTDFYPDGTLIPMDEWRKMHTVSFASGLAATDEMQLDLAHIVTRGSDEIHRDCCWNTMILTHEEHMKQHEIGWNDFLKIYPHLKGRVDRAREMAGKLTLQER